MLYAHETLLISWRASGIWFAVRTAFVPPCSENFAPLWYLQTVPDAHEIFTARPLMLSVPSPPPVAVSKVGFDTEKDGEQLDDTLLVQPEAESDPTVAATLPPETPAVCPEREAELQLIVLNVPNQPFNSILLLVAEIA